ncbi:MAG: hypothetical protein ACYYKD_07050 [Rhodospirillales bacterium]
MAIQPNAFAQAFINAGLNENRAGFNLRFRLLQNAYIRRMNEQIAEFNTPSAPERQKEASLNAEIKKLAEEQALLVRYTEDIKININHMRKISNALTVMSEARTPIDARVKSAVKFRDRTPDDVIRGAAGAFQDVKVGDEINLGGGGDEDDADVKNGKYIVKFVSGDHSRIRVTRKDGHDAGFPSGGVAPAGVTVERKKLLDTGPTEMTFESGDTEGSDFIRAAPGTFSKDLDGKTITVSGTAAHDGDYLVDFAQDDGSAVFVTALDGTDAGFPEGVNRVTESAAQVTADNDRTYSIGSGGLTFKNGGNAKGDDLIEAAPGAFDDFAKGDTIRLKEEASAANPEGDFKITKVSKDGSRIRVTQTDGSPANFVNEDDSVTVREIRREPILSNLAFNDSDRIRERKKAGLDDSIIGQPGVFSGLKAGDSVILYSNTKSKNKGEFLVTSVSDDASEIFVRSPNNDDAGLVTESGGAYQRTIRKKTAASTVNLQQQANFRAGRDLVLKHLHAIQQLSHADLSDFGEASRIKSLMKDFREMDIAVGNVGQSTLDAVSQANYDTFQKVGKMTIRLSNAQLATGGILTTANKVAGTISRKSRTVQSKLQDMTGLQQAEAAADIQKLRQRYATLLDAISIGYDAQYQGYSKLAEALGPRQVPPGSVLNLFS